MTYEKPEISVLGEAALLIQLSTRKGGVCVDGSPLHPYNADAPTYELDE